MTRPRPSMKRFRVLHRGGNGSQLKAAEHCARGFCHGISHHSGVMSQSVERCTDQDRVVDRSRILRCRARSRGSRPCRSISAPFACIGKLRKRAGVRVAPAPAPANRRRCAACRPASRGRRRRRTSARTRDRSRGAGATARGRRSAAGRCAGPVRRLPCHIAPPARTLELLAHRLVGRLGGVWRTAPACLAKAR